MCGSESGLCAKGKGGVGLRSFSNWRWDWYSAGADADRERRYKLTRRGTTTTTTTATRITRSKIQNCGVSTTILLLGLTGWLTHRLTRWLTRSLAFLALLIATTTVAPPTWRHDYMLRLIQSHTQTYIHTHKRRNACLHTYAHSCIALCVCVHTLSHTFWIYLLACQPEAKAGQQQQQCAATRRGETSGERTAGVGEREKERGEVRRRGAAQAPQWAPLT